MYVILLIVILLLGILSFLSFFQRPECILYIVVGVGRISTGGGLLWAGVCSEPGTSIWPLVWLHFINSPPSSMLFHPVLFLPSLSVLQSCSDWTSKHSAHLQKRPFCALNKAIWGLVQQRMAGLSASDVWCKVCSVCFCRDVTSTSSTETAWSSANRSWATQSLLSMEVRPKLLDSLTLN